MGIQIYYFVSVVVTMIVFVLNLSGTHLKFKTKIPANARYKLVCRNFAFDNHNINQRQNVIYGVNPSFCVNSLLNLRNDV